MSVQDLARYIVIASLASVLLYRIHNALEKVLKGRIESTEMSACADEMMLPSITFCLPKLEVDSMKSENITADYNALHKLEDMLASLTQRVTSENG